MSQKLTIVPSVPLRRELTGLGPVKQFLIVTFFVLQEKERGTPRESSQKWSTKAAASQKVCLKFLVFPKHVGEIYSMPPVPLSPLTIMLKWISTYMSRPLPVKRCRRPPTLDPSWPLRPLKTRKIALLAWQMRSNQPWATCSNNFSSNSDKSELDHFAANPQFLFADRTD